MLRPGLRLAEIERDRLVSSRDRADGKVERPGLDDPERGLPLQLILRPVRAEVSVAQVVQDGNALPEISAQGHRQHQKESVHELLHVCDLVAVVLSRVRRQVQNPVEVRERDARSGNDVDRLIDVSIAVHEQNHGAPPLTVTSPGAVCVSVKRLLKTSTFTGRPAVAPVPVRIIFVSPRCP